MFTKLFTKEASFYLIKIYLFHVKNVPHYIPWRQSTSTCCVITLFASTHSVISRASCNVIWRTAEPDVRGSIEAVQREERSRSPEILKTKMSHATEESSRYLCCALRSRVLEFNDNIDEMQTNICYSTKMLINIILYVGKD